MMNTHYKNQRCWGKTATLTARPNVKTLLITLILVFGLCMNFAFMGCSGGGGSDSTATTTTNPGTTDPVTDPGTGSSYAGDATISGSINISTLSSQDSSQLSSPTTDRVVRFKKGFVADEYAESDKHNVYADAASAAVKLYVVGSDGELEDTGISCEFTDVSDPDNPQFECDGVKDGVSYIIRYIKMAGDGKALEMKAHAHVAEGETTQTGTLDVTPQSSVIVEALVTAIIDATTGADIEDEVVNNIIEAVKTTIETLVNTGVIRIPSMIVEVEGDTIEEVLGEKTEDNMDNTVAQIINNEDVKSDLDVAKSDVLSNDLIQPGANATDAEKEAYIRKVMNKLFGGDDDMPGFLLDFFVYMYVNGDTYPLSTLGPAVMNGFSYCNSDHECSDAVPTPAGYPVFGTDLTAAGGMAVFNTAMTDVYALLDKKDAGTELTEEEKEALGDFPPIMIALFPRTSTDNVGNGWNAITDATEFNVARGIAYVLFFEDVYVDGYLEDNSLKKDIESFDEESKDRDHYRIYEFEPSVLLQLFEFGAYATAHMSEFAAYEINGLWLHPNIYWDPDTNTEKDLLSLGTGVMKPSDMLAEMTGGTPTGMAEGDYMVKLTYPTRTGGTNTITLDFRGSEGGMGAGWGLEPFSSCDGEGGGACPDPSKVVNDFTSGSYVVKLYNAAGTTLLASKLFEKKVITGMVNVKPVLLTPVPWPDYPDSNASQEVWDAFNAASAQYKQTVFSANVMSTGEEPGEGETATHAKITATWKAPTVELPDGVKMAYNVDIGSSENCDENGCDWEHIWSTWDEGDDGLVYTTSITLPKTAVMLVAGNESKEYHLNVGIQFIDKATGDNLGSGGSAHAGFKVGEPLDMTKKFTISGSNAVEISSDMSSDDNCVDGLKAVLVASYSQYDATAQMHEHKQKVLAIASVEQNKNYTLQPTLGDFLENADLPAGAWYEILLVADSDGVVAVGTTHETLNTLCLHWPDWASGGMWFDTWGGTLRVFKDTCDSSGTCSSNETVISGGETVIGPKFQIGSGGYVPPEPEGDPVTDDAATFTVTGSVTDESGSSALKIAFIQNSYNSSGMYVQTIKALADVTSGAYTLILTISDFFSEGDTWFDFVLLDTTDNGSLDVDSLLPFDIPMWWPDYMNGSMWFNSFDNGTDKFLEMVEGSCDENGCTETRVAITGTGSESFSNGPRFITGAYSGSLTETYDGTTFLPLTDSNGNKWELYTGIVPISASAVVGKVDGSFITVDGETENYAWVMGELTGTLSTGIVSLSGTVEIPGETPETVTVSFTGTYTQGDNVAVTAGTIVDGSSATIATLPTNTLYYFNPNSGGGTTAP